MSRKRTYKHNMYNVNRQPAIIDGKSTHINEEETTNANANTQSNTNTNESNTMNENIENKTPLSQTVIAVMVGSFIVIIAGLIGMMKSIVIAWKQHAIAATVGAAAGAALAFFSFGLYAPAMLAATTYYAVTGVVVSVVITAAESVTGLVVDLISDTRFGKWVSDKVASFKKWNAERLYAKAQKAVERADAAADALAA